jgi:serine/threonine protein kinase
VRDGAGLRGYRQGLIHRDVKPANLLAVMDGDQVTDVKITDFGSVLQPDADRTQVYRVGSLAYMSPEQLDGEHAGLPRRHLCAGRRAVPPDRRAARRSTPRAGRR